MQPEKDLLKEAILEELEKEFNSIPPIDELEKLYTFSERHKQSMRENFDKIEKDKL